MGFCSFECLVFSFEWQKENGMIRFVRLRRDKCVGPLECFFGNAPERRIGFGLWFLGLRLRDRKNQPLIDTNGCGAAEPQAKMI